MIIKRIAIIAALAFAASGVAAQVPGSVNPSPSGLPTEWTLAGPLQPAPPEWSATISYAVQSVQSPEGAFTAYWYRIRMGGDFSPPPPPSLAVVPAPLHIIYSIVLDLDPNTHVVGGNPTFLYGQYEVSPPNADGLSLAAEPLIREDSTLRWSMDGGAGNGLRSGETVYLWVATQSPHQSMQVLNLQAGNWAAQTVVVAPTAPEPGAFVVMGAGLMAMIPILRRRK